MDPQDFTSADAYAEYVADNMPDLAEVSAAALALIKALMKLDGNKLVTRVEPTAKLADWVAEIIPEAFDFDEEERFPFVIREEFTALVNKERFRWIATIDQQHVDAILAARTINLAGMVQTILTGGKS